MGVIRNVSGLMLEAESPCNYKVVGWDGYRIMYGNQELLGENYGWYICRGNGAIRHSDPHESLASAAERLYRQLVLKVQER